MKKKLSFSDILRYSFFFIIKNGKLNIKIDFNKINVPLKVCGHTGVTGHLDINVSCM